MRNWNERESREKQSAERRRIDPEYGAIDYPTYYDIIEEIDAFLAECRRDKLDDTL